MGVQDQVWIITTTIQVVVDLAQTWDQEVLDLVQKRKRAKAEKKEKEERGERQDLEADQDQDQVWDWIITITIQVGVCQDLAQEDWIITITTTRVEVGQEVD